MSSNYAIQIPKGKLESQFIFFYNLGAKINSIDSEQDGEFFESRNIGKSSLNKFSFVDNLVPSICTTHFHAKKDLLIILNNKIGQIVSGSGSDIDVELRIDPPTFSNNHSFKDQEDGYSPLEFTLFKNGMLAVICRVTNATEIGDEQYVKSIARSEHVGFNEFEDDQDVTLTQIMWRSMEVVEGPLNIYLNELELHGIPFTTGLSQQMKFYSVEDNNGGETAKIVDDKPFSLRRGEFYSGKLYFHSCFVRTRPYVGTVIDLSSSISEFLFKESEEKHGAVLEEKINLIKGIKEREMKLALACARTTPEFLDYFNGPEKYLEQDVPRRNLYHPGPSIVFIGRRGWACILKETRPNPKSFHFGVVETVVFVIEAMLSSTIHSRNFIREVTKEGDSLALELLKNFQEGNKNQKERKSMNIDPSTIYNFTAFVSRIKLNLPYQNLGTLLSAHITTHTGIAAIRRMKYLTKQDSLLLSSRNLVDNYDSFFTNLDQYWSDKQAKDWRKGFVTARKKYYVAIWALVGTMATLMVAIATLTFQLSESLPLEGDNPSYIEPIEINSK